jgi:hypothetical protein
MQASDHPEGFSFGMFFISALRLHAKVQAFDRLQQDMICLKLIFLNYIESAGLSPTRFFRKRQPEGFKRGFSYTPRRASFPTDN